MITDIVAISSTVRLVHINTTYLVSWINPGIIAYKVIIASLVPVINAFRKNLSDNHGTDKIIYCI